MSIWLILHSVTKSGVCTKPPTEKCPQNVRCFSSYWDQPFCVCISNLLVSARVHHFSCTFLVEASLVGMCLYNPILLRRRWDASWVDLHAVCVHVALLVLPGVKVVAHFFHWILLSACADCSAKFWALVLPWRQGGVQEQSWYGSSYLCFSQSLGSRLASPVLLDIWVDNCRV